MTEARFGMSNEEMLNRLPIALIVFDALAVRTHMDQPPKRLNLHQILLQAFVFVAKHLVHVDEFKIGLHKIAKLHHEFFKFL